MEFRPLASSSAGCCYHLSSGTLPPLLIDAGIRFKGIQVGTGFKVSALAGALISHAHGDHCSAVPDLIRAGIPIISSRETAEALKINSSWLSMAFPPRQLIYHKGWTILPFEAVHDQPGTLGFVIGDQEGHKLLYLTDSAYSLYRFEGLTHIAVECNFSKDILQRNTASGSIGKERYARTTKTHMSLDRLIDMLKANDLSKVEEIHLLHLSDANSDEAEFKDAVQRATGCPVYVAPKFARNA